MVSADEAGGPGPCAQISSFGSALNNYMRQRPVWLHMEVFRRKEFNPAQRPAPPGVAVAIASRQVVFRAVFRDAQ